MGSRFKVLAIILIAGAWLLAMEVQMASAEYRTTLQPSMTVSQEYTDNVDQLPDGLEESEWITVVSPSIALDVVGKTKGLNMSYTTGFTFYADRKEHDTIRQSGAMSA